MSEQNLKSLLQALPNYPQKEQLVQSVIKLQQKSIDAEKKYEKANNDKLIMSHLLAQVNEELEDALKNEKRFVASVSHELRTPLTAILGYSELMRDTQLSNKQMKYLDYIVQSSNHLLSLISDLLDVAKLEDNRIELSPRECDLDDVLHECISLIEPRVNPNVEFITDIPPFEYSVIADDKRLKQVFINLLTNAAKFTKKGSIKFYLKDIYEKNDDILHITINVDDTGSGIPEDMLKSIFDPFKSTDKTQGTGLGLYISQQLIYLMNGEITVESKVGVGSSFSVSFEVPIASKKEIGKGLDNANIIMFSERNELSLQLSKELANFGANFQLHEISNKNDFSAPIAQMVIGCQFQDIIILDQNIFGKHTNDIAGTLKSIKPNIKLVALVNENSDLSFSEFELVLNYPISSYRVIKSLENIYSQEFFEETETIDYSNLNVLVVEDVDINREYEKEMLDNFFSISCDTAANGKEAVEMAKNNKYDIILMDVRMPVMDGLEATRRIREFDKETPIICMSANVYKEDKLEAEEAGMNDFIEKPLEKKDIQEKLNKYIHKMKASESAISASSNTQESATDTEDNSNLKEQAYNHLIGNFDEAIAQRLLNKGIESIHTYMTNIDKDFEEKDTKMLMEDFHALKGVLSNLGLKSLSRKASELEELSKSGNLMEVDKLKNELFNKLKNLFEDKE